MARNTLLSLSGAQLRALAPTSPAHADELARRIAKREASGHVTIAALQSWGRVDEAAALVAAAKTAPAKAPKAAPAPAPVVLTRTTEVVGKKPTLTVRMTAVEGSLVAIASALESQDKVLRELVAKLCK